MIRMNISNWLRDKSKIMKTNLVAHFIICFYGNSSYKKITNNFLESQRFPEVVVECLKIKFIAK
jgi:hypothetical protein